MGPDPTQSNAPPEGSIEVAALLLYPEEEERDEAQVTKTHKIAFKCKFPLLLGMDLSSRGVPSCIRNCLDTHSPSKPSQNQQGPKKSAASAAFNFKFLAGLPRL